MANKKIKKIGVLTSGGDSPGMNAAIRAITRTAISHGIRVMAIKNGYRGLIYGDKDDNIVEYFERSVSNIIDLGGTVLYTDRCDEFRTEEGMQKAVDTCKKYKIGGLVVIGGDGTFRGGTDLSKRGIPTIGVPATIDNDITASDYTIGFDTALNTVLEMVDRLRITSESHARCSVVEVMGRDAGYIALQGGIAAGATAIAIKEIPFCEADCIKRIIDSRKNLKRQFLIIVSEGMGETYAKDLAVKIENDTGIITRDAKLGHVQRGGSPTVRDRNLGTILGNRAVELLLEGKKNRVVCIQKDDVIDLDIEYALNLDSRYKGNLSDEDFAKLCECDQKNINDFIEHRKKKMNDFYEIMKKVSI
jgi:6-phosphofructokinase 1